MCLPKLKSVCCRWAAIHNRWRSSSTLGWHSRVTTLTGQIFWLWASAFDLGHCLSKHKTTRYARNLGCTIFPLAPLAMPMSDVRRNKKIATRIGKPSAVLRELYRSVVTTWEFSNTAFCKIELFLLVFVPILSYGHKSWVMTERKLSHVQAAEMGFCQEFTVWHFATKCAAVKFIKPWILSHFFEKRDVDYIGLPVCPECPRWDWRVKSCWVHPREGVEWLHLRSCLVPSWCGASRTIWDFCWPWGISGPLRAAVWATITRG